MNILNEHSENKILFSINKESDDRTNTLMFLNDDNEVKLVKDWFNKVGEDVFILSLSDLKFSKKEQELIYDVFGSTLKKNEKSFLTSNFEKVKEKIKIDNYFESLKKKKKKNKDNVINKFDTDYYYLVFHKKYLCSFIIDNPTHSMHNILLNNTLGFILYHKFKKKFYKKSIKKIKSLLNSEHDSEKSLKETIKFINKKFNKNSNKEISLENLIKSYIKDRYDISDDIKKKLSASYLCSEIENHLIKLKENKKDEHICLKDFVKGKVKFRNNLSKILLSLDLKKKRFQDGFYYYGLKEFNNVERKLNKYCIKNTSPVLNLKTIDISKLKINHILNKKNKELNLELNDYKYINEYEKIVISQYMIFNKDFLKNIKKEWNNLAIIVNTKEKIPNTSHYLNTNFYYELLKNVYDNFKFSDFTLIINKNDEDEIKTHFNNKEYFYKSKIKINIYNTYNSTFTKYKFLSYELPKGGIFSVKQKKISDNLLKSKNYSKLITNLWYPSFNEFGLSETSDELLSLSSNNSSCSEIVVKNNDHILDDLKKRLNRKKIKSLYTEIKYTSSYSEVELSDNESDCSIELSKKNILSDNDSDSDSEKIENKKYSSNNIIFSKISKKSINKKENKYSINSSASVTPVRK
jgi:hypothetical protein